MNNKPVHKIRIGNITASIWANEGQKGTFYNVTINRSYKDGIQWKDTHLPCGQMTQPHPSRARVLRK